MVGVFVTTLGVLFGVFSAGARFVGTPEENETTAILTRIIPLVALSLDVFVWMADVALQNAQKVTRSRGAELERLLGLERGLFTQMFHWRMQRWRNVDLREIVALLIAIACVGGYIWTWQYDKPRTEPLQPRAVPVRILHQSTCQMVPSVWTYIDRRDKILRGKENRP